MYSEEFNQHYHSCRDGALNESLSKHIIPALTYHKDKKELNILDICFGLGYNTLSTIYYIKQNNLDIKLNIYSPEFDKELIESLKSFHYPKEFDCIKNIIDSLSLSYRYKDINYDISLYIGDALEYLDILKAKDIKCDIVYQDAFSSEVNRELWTKSYFSKICDILSDDAIITTYSIATPVRLSMWENGLNIYQIESDARKSTIALNKNSIDDRYKYIDMELKKQRNKNAKAL